MRARRSTSPTRSSTCCASAMMTMTTTPPDYSRAQLAERFGLPLQGNGATRITGVGSLEQAQPGQLGFVMHERYAAQLAATRASAVIMPPALASGYAGNALLADNPHAAFARIAALFD